MAKDWEDIQETFIKWPLLYIRQKVEHGLTFYSPDKQVKYRTKAKILSIITLHIEKKSRNGWKGLLVQGKW